VDETAAEAEGRDLANRFRTALLARRAPFTAIREDRLIIGPSIIQVPFSVPAGVKLSLIEGQEEDIARDLGVEAVRISNWPGEPGLAVAELPRRDRSFPDVTSLERPDDSPYVTVAIGAQIDYAPLWINLDDLPHLLIGGTTGSGKSVFLRSMLWQLTSLWGPDEVDLVLIDAKGLADYLDFVNAPHFKSESDFHLGVAGALEVFERIIDEEIPRRTEVFRNYAASALNRQAPRHITRLRDLLGDARDQNVVAPVRPLVVIIDEFAELVLASSDRRRFETAVTRFNQIARAVGGHLVAATQRPSTDVVTGLMKSNFARVALRVQQSVDSRVILDENGAETLLGRGDLLFKSPELGLVRLQGYAARGPYSY
jgi:S-DNA-T family DNA segregation ATPase FtsK/SpoIIIE